MDTPDHVAALLARPDILASIEHAREHPEESVELDLPPSTEVDWEDPD